MSGAVKVLLIGGTSHTGKSTLAERVASQLGWRHLSTDQLARHPGRPWRNDSRPAPAHVADHYATLSPRVLTDTVVHHYRHNVWPIVDAFVRCQINNPYDSGLVLEGSAILPDLVRGAVFDRSAAVWLTATDEVLTDRILTGSRCADRLEAEQVLIRAFLERSLLFNRLIVESLEQLGLPGIDAASADVPGLLSRVRDQRAPTA